MQKGHSLNCKCYNSKAKPLNVDRQMYIQLSVLHKLGYNLKTDPNKYPQEFHKIIKLINLKSFLFALKRKYYHTVY